MNSDPNKPPYRVPSMDEIRALPWNGLKVASTFSGCGGSCLGYRMAGFRVVWANEFVPAAQESYKANAADDCYLDRRDIRLVQPQEILDQCGVKQGELDLFDGSPPCQAFSTAGKRAKGWGQAKTYEHGASQCNETLFTEYIRLLRGLMPKVFVAENVSGLVKGVAKGYFLDILRDLKASGYRVTCKILDAQWLGVPQSRRRTIFVGVREDLNLEPVHPKPLAYRYSVRDALPWIMNVEGANGFNSHAYQAATIQAGRTLSVEAETDTSRYAIGVEPHRGWQDSKDIARTIRDSDVCPSILTDGRGFHGVIIKSGNTEKRKFTIAELRRICAFPDDFTLTGSYAQQWERLGNSVPPLMMKEIAVEIRDGVLAKLTGRKPKLEGKTKPKRRVKSKA